ncbi:MAG: AAA family ATPase [Treponema sp.]|nr:AAA family ATPase [Treponema sp.]
MNESNIFNSGSRWLRADFHLHTNADSEFKYNGDRENFVSDYITKLVKENISVGVITNHNKFDLKEFKELRKEAKKKDIFLLPGVEFSLKDGAKGIHMLIVFDYEWIDNQENENHIQYFLDFASIGIHNFSGSPYPNSNFNLQDAYEKLNEFKKDYFFVMAHVDDNNGMFKELEGRNLNSFLESEAFKKKVLAVQKSRNIQNRSRIEEKALVEGTDNAHGGIAALGCGNEVNGEPQRTYIKLGDCNFGALQYALQDSNHRVRNCIPSIKNAYIKSVSIEGGAFDGQEVDFSSELNSFIGIRGSGKSSLLEIIRYVLGLSLLDSSVDMKYKKDLIEYALGSGGKVILYFVDEHGAEYRIEKIYGKTADIYKVSTNEQLHCSIEALVNNVIYYGQNDLSNKKQSFQSDLLTKLVSPDKELRQHIESKKKEIREIVHQIQSVSTEISQIKEVEQQIRDTEHKLRYFKDNGLEEKLKFQTDFNSDETKILQAQRLLEQFKADIRNLYSNYENSFTQDLHGSELNKEIFTLINAEIHKANTELKKIGSTEKNISLILSSYNIAVEQLHSKGEILKNDFAKIKRELNSETINPDSFLNLTRFLETSKLKLQELNKMKDKKESLSKDLEDCLSNLNGLLKQGFDILNKKAKEINESNANLKIEVIFEGNRKAFLKKLEDTFKGTGIREQAYHNIADNFLDFTEIYRRQNELSAYLSENNLYEFKNRLNKNLAELLSFEVEHSIVISYKGQRLDKLSLGKRSSALILFLLTRKDNNILIIDQPEDDLDNQVIYDEVIKELLELKGQMQFIFATHNPNIPVLGDSEKILAFNASVDKKIEILQGSIDTPLLQTSIVKIMEGGKEAFARRNTIYNAWSV